MRPIHRTVHRCVASKRPTKSAALGNRLLSGALQYWKTRDNVSAPHVSLRLSIFRGGGPVDSQQRDWVPALEALL